LETVLSFQEGLRSHNLTHVVENEMQMANQRGSQISDEQEQALFVCMRQSYDLYKHGLASMSGADQADSEIHRIERLFYVMVWAGGSIEDALSTCQTMWRTYAEMNNAKVAAAPKTKRGPYAGASSMHWRWTDPDRWSDIHLRYMARKILNTA